VIIPAYEADNIWTRSRARRPAPLDIEHEILVIDDGDTDGTGAIVTTNHRFPHVSWWSTIATGGSDGRTARVEVAGSTIS
jgi:glycosyltransferase involved in cell wall biosynthesis